MKEPIGFQLHFDISTARWYLFITQGTRIAEPLVMTDVQATIDAGRAIHPTMAVAHHEADVFRALCAELIRAGFGPDPANTEIQRMKDHLHDMRRIAFSMLEVEEP